MSFYLERSDISSSMVFGSWVGSIALMTRILWK